MSEQDLIDLGFELIQESKEAWGSDSDFHYYSLDLGGITLISKGSDEWENDSIYVNIMESDITFRGSGDLWDFIEILQRQI